MTLTQSAHLDTFTRDNLPPVDQWPSFNEKWLAEHYPDRLNCAVELLDGTISRLGGAGCAVTDGEESWTYDELADRVQRTANVLVALGVVPGNRVLLRGPNNPWLAVTWLAVVRIGAVVVTTMPLLRTGELEKIVDIAQVQFALVDHRFVEEWSGVANFAGLTLVFGGADPDDLEQLVAEASNVHMPVDTAADDVCMLAFTSGTTGKPKAAMHFHRDVLAIADSFCASIVQPTAADIFAGSPPFAFTFGLGALLIFPLRFGACALLLESASPPILLRAVELNRVTCLFTAPTAYRAMLPSVGEVDLSSLRVCISAGENLPEPTWRAWKQATGQSLIDGIGATEMLHVFISARGDEIVPGSTGKAVPGYIVDVVDDDFNSMPPGQPGRLVVKGPTGCRYLNDERQFDYVQGGWNVTGDVYIKDENGYFFYQARADDIILSSGYNIAAPEVESALLAHVAVQETAVVGQPDEARGMIVKAFVVLNPAATASDGLVHELQAFVKASIAPYKYPREIEFVIELPKTATGKLQRFKLR